jgi:hypothetical protein
MQSITSITATAPEFELCNVHWKGTEFSFWCKVLSAKEHRQATDYFSKDGTLDLGKYREQADAFVSMCVYVPAVDLPDSKRPTVSFTDSDGEQHEVRQWLSKGEAGELKAALLDKLRTEVEKINRLKSEEDLGKE